MYLYHYQYHHHHHHPHPFLPLKRPSVCFSSLLVFVDIHDEGDKRSHSDSTHAQNQDIREHREIPAHADTNRRLSYIHLVGREHNPAFYLGVWYGIRDKILTRVLDNVPWSTRCGIWPRSVHHVNRDIVDHVSTILWVHIHYLIHLLYKKIYLSDALLSSVGYHIEQNNGNRFSVVPPPWGKNSRRRRDEIDVYLFSLDQHQHEKKKAEQHDEMSSLKMTMHDDVRIALMP